MMIQVETRQIYDYYRHMNQIQIISTVSSQSTKDSSNQTRNVEKPKEQIKHKIKYRKSKRQTRDQSSVYIPEAFQESVEENIGDSEIKQTKNIPKLYVKAITFFLKKMEQKVQYILEKQGINKQDFYQKVELYQRKVTSIQGIRQMWQNNNNQFARVFRILSNLFFRKHILHHIFNSKIYLCRRALKYKYKFIEGVKNPQSFTLIKQF